MCVFIVETEIFQNPFYNKIHPNIIKCLGDSNKYTKRMFSWRITWEYQWKNTRSADFFADQIDVITDFAVITNVVIKGVHCRKKNSMSALSNQSVHCCLLQQTMRWGCKHFDRQQSFRIVIMEATDMTENISQVKCILSGKTRYFLAGTARRQRVFLYFIHLCLVSQN